MLVQVGSTGCSTVAIPTREFLLKPMELLVQAIAPMSTSPMLFGTFCLETVFKALDCMVGLLRTKELIDAALELLVLAYVASKNQVGLGEYLSNTRETIAHMSLPAVDVRFAVHIDASLAQDSNLKNAAFSSDEIDRSPDRCKASRNDMILQVPVQGPDCLWAGDISEWIISAARGKDEVNSNHTKTDKAFASGKKDNNVEDDDEDEDDEDDVEDEGESGDEENDDGEGEEEGNEDDDDDEEDEEEEEDDEEDDEEVAPISAHGNIAVQNDEEEDDDSDDGEDEEEGLEDEDDFGEEGEEEDGEEDEEDEEDEDDEEVPEPPKKKNKSS